MPYAVAWFVLALWLLAATKSIVHSGKGLFAHVHACAHIITRKYENPLDGGRQLLNGAELEPLVWSETMSSNEL